MTKIFIMFLGFLFFSCSDQKEFEDKDISHKEDIKLAERKSIHQEEWEEHNKNKKTDETSFTNFDVIIESSKSITDKNIGSFNYPQFTLDGRNIVFTTNDYNQIWIYNLESAETKKLVSIPRCGYKYQISDDGQHIYFRNRAMNGKRSGGTYSIFKYSIEDKKLDVIYTSKKRLSLPVLINSSIYLLENDQPISLNVKSKTVSKRFHPPYLYVNNNELIRVSERVDTIEIPKNIIFIDCDYSKDKQKIITLTANNGNILFDLEGNLVNQFEDARTLKKLYKSNLVLYINEEDDGQKIISSTLHFGFIDSDKSIEINLNESELIFNPDWSPTDNKIVYATDSGIIKIISFKIEKTK